MASAMHNGVYTGRHPPSLEEQCVAQLKVWEPHVSLRNVELLSQVADELKLEGFPLRELTGRHLPSISTLFKNQLRIAPTLAGDDFIHIVGTVAQEKTHIYIQQVAAHKNVLTVTVRTVDKNHDVQFRFLTNNAEDASHFIVHFLDKDASTFSHLPAKRTSHPVRFF
jgi:hypothetical protein